MPRIDYYLNTTMYLLIEFISAYDNINKQCYFHKNEIHRECAYSTTVIVEAYFMGEYAKASYGVRRAL